MAEFNFEAEPTLADLKRQRKEYRKEVQRSVAKFLTLTRISAATKVMIPNTTGILNPYMARKVQPANPSRLTHRTKKMRWMLLENADPNLAGWGGFGNKLAKLDTSALKLLVRAVEQGQFDEFLGTIRVWISRVPPILTHRGTVPQYDDKGKLLNKGYKPKMMPRETMRTLAMRFMWELGIRGSRRPYMEPAAKMILKKLPLIIERRIDLIWSKI